MCHRDYRRAMDNDSLLPSTGYSSRTTSSWARPVRKENKENGLVSSDEREAPPDKPGASAASGPRQAGNAGNGRALSILTSRAGGLRGKLLLKPALTRPKSSVASGPTPNSDEFLRNPTTSDGQNTSLLPAPAARAEQKKSPIMLICNHPQRLGETHHPSATNHN